MFNKLTQIFFPVCESLSHTHTHAHTHSLPSHTTSVHLEINAVGLNYNFIIVSCS